MRLITKKTTFEEFKNRKHWLIKEPTTGTLHHIELTEFNSSGHLWYASSKHNSYDCSYVRDGIRGSILGLPTLFNILRTGKFVFKW